MWSYFFGETFLSVTTAGSREVEPELMETLIQATKVGDHSTLQALAASKMQIAGDVDVETEETENEEKEEVLYNIKYIFCL